MVSTIYDPKRLFYSIKIRQNKTAVISITTSKDDQNLHVTDQYSKRCIPFAYFLIPTIYRYKKLVELQFFHVFLGVDYENGGPVFR